MKLTLSIKKSVIEGAEKYASEKGINLSEIVETYLVKLAKNQEHKPSSQKGIRSLKGILKNSEDVDYKKTIEEEIFKKHG
ncbi:DUF6364 family protein [Litoribacter ruber]|uniref:DUF6364 family protein n=1 Tax=Litoribacter ruber TaxID=702568 RepID=UPI001FE6C13E|nr:DUF6364 family protein [Litoribacter ruber]